MRLWSGLAQVLAHVGYARVISEAEPIFPVAEELPADGLEEVEGEAWLVAFAGCLAVGVLVGWVSYSRTGDVLEATIDALVAMTIMAIGWGLGPYIDFQP